MSISEAVLFVASNSRASIHCLNFVHTNRIPVVVVRLDSEETRRAAASGRYFQITSVPTMMITYEDGNTQLFLGAPKIIQWLETYIRSQIEAQTRVQKEEEEVERARIDNMYGPVDNIPTNVRAPIIDEGDDMNFSNVEEEGSEDEPEFIPEPKPKAKSKAKTPAKSKAKKKAPKKKEPVVFEEDEPEFIDQETAARSEAKKKINHANSSKSKPLKSKMKDIYSAAKQMEMDMKSTLGYEEKDLPHF